MLLAVLGIMVSILEYAIIAYVVLSWIVRPNTRLAEVYMALARYLEPILGPVRKLMEPLTYRLRIDFSPWVTIIVIRFLYRLLRSLLAGF